MIMRNSCKLRSFYSIRVCWSEGSRLASWRQEWDLKMYDTNYFHGMRCVLVIKAGLEPKRC